MKAQPGQSLQQAQEWFLQLLPTLGQQPGQLPMRFKEDQSEPERHPEIPLMCGDEAAGSQTHSLQSAGSIVALTDAQSASGSANGAGGAMPVDAQATVRTATVPAASPTDCAAEGPSRVLLNALERDPSFLCVSNF